MIYLASGSPRRKELLTQIGCRFEIVKSNAEELKDSTLSPDALVMENACRKAEEAASSLEKDAAVLGADTVVALDGKIFGKPKDEKDAARMLSELSGRSHEVYTGIAIVANGKTFRAVEKTLVEFRTISDEEIKKYIKTGEPMDKAGAYAVQGIAAKFIPRIEGSFSNVVGLPIAAVDSLARKAGVELYGNIDA